MEKVIAYAGIRVFNENTEKIPIRLKYGDKDMQAHIRSIKVGDIFWINGMSHALKVNSLVDVPLAGDADYSERVFYCIKWVMEV